MLASVLSVFAAFSMLNESQPLYLWMVRYSHSAKMQRFFYDYDLPCWFKGKNPDKLDPAKQAECNLIPKSTLVSVHSPKVLENWIVSSPCPSR